MEFGPIAAAPADETARRRRRRRRVALLVVLAIGASVTMRRRLYHGVSPAEGAAAVVQRPSRVVPDSVRIKVDVVNATATRGLGRLATAWLRDMGFDVVGTLTAPEAERRDSSLVLDRSGHPEWARMAAAAIGGARVEARPDSSRYVDLTVFVGRSWRAPPQTLYP